MGDFISKYTGAQIDLSVASGSSTTGFISGSLEGTGSFGRLEVVGDTNLTGDITVGGNLTLGDADTDSVSITADLTSNLIPNADNSFDLGTDAKSWHRLFVGQISASGDISASGNLYVNSGSFNTFDNSGRTLTVEGDISASGALMGVTNITASGDLTVLGDISASGNIKANEFHTNVTSASITYASGSNKFGDTLDDIQNITGSTYTTGSITIGTELSSSAMLTVNGAVSASGEIHGSTGKFSQIEIDGESALNTSDSATTGQVFVDSQITKIVLGKGGAVTSTVIEGHITASGDISGSSTSTGSFGKLQVDSASIGSLTTALTVPTDTKISFDSTDTFIKSNTDNPEDLEIHADANILLDPDSSLLVAGNTTVTGILSGSQRFDIITENFSNVVAQVRLQNNDSGTTNGVSIPGVILQSGSAKIDIKYRAADRLSGNPHDGNNSNIRSLRFSSSFGGNIVFDYSKEEGEDTGSSTPYVGIGNSFPSKALTVQGDISSSGFIFIKETGSAFQGVDGGGAGYLFASSSGQLCYQSGSDVASVITLGGGGGTDDVSWSDGTATTISGSSTSTGSFGTLRLTDSGSTLNFIGDITGSSLSTGSFGNLNVGTITITRGTDGTDRSANPGNLYMTSNNIIKTDDSLHIANALNVNNSKFIVNNSPVGNDITVDGDMNVTSHISASANISGSLVTTGSFARVENVDKLILTTQTVGAAGDAQGNAGAIDANGGSTVFVTGADSTKGVVLPVVANSTIGQTYTIHNTVSGQTLKVYPGSGDKILPAGDNTAITIAANTCVVVTHFSADGYVGYEPAVIVSD